MRQEPLRGSEQGCNVNLKGLLGKGVGNGFWGEQRELDLENAHGKAGRILKGLETKAVSGIEAERGGNRGRWTS